MENAIQETNKMILEVEEKNRGGIDGSNVLSLQDTVTKREKTRAEEWAEFNREIEAISEGIKEYQIAEHGRVLTQAEWIAPFEEWREESRKKTEASFVAYLAPLMPPLTAENLPELREYWGEDIMQMVEDFIKTSNGKVPHGTK